MADKLNYIRDAKTGVIIPSNYHDTLGDGSKYAQDVNVVAGAVTATPAGTAFMVHAELTRPANTTTYDALDGVTDSTTTPTALEWANINRATGLGVLLLSARLYKYGTTVTNAYFRTWLYADTPASVPLDNAAWASRWANREIGLGYIDWTNPILGGDCVVYEGLLSGTFVAPVIPLARSLFGINQATAAYAPASGEKFDIYLRGQQY